MGQLAVGQPLGGRSGSERRRSGVTLRSIVGFSPYIGAVIGVALLVEAGWYWFALDGRSAPATSAAYRDPLGAVFIGVLLVAQVAMLVASRSVGRGGSAGLSVDVAAVLVFGLLTLVTWALTTFGLTTNLPDSDYPLATRDLPLFFVSFGLAFGAGLLMMLDHITRT